MTTRTPPRGVLGSRSRPKPKARPKKTAPKRSRLQRALSSASCRQDYEAAVYAELRADGASGAEARAGARRIVAQVFGKPKARRRKPLETMHVPGVGSVPVPTSAKRCGLPPEESAALARRMGLSVERRVIHTPTKSIFGVSLTTLEADAVESMPRPALAPKEPLPTVGRLPKAESYALAKRMGLTPDHRADVRHTATRTTFGVKR